MKQLYVVTLHGEQAVLAEDREEALKAVFAYEDANPHTKLYSYSAAPMESVPLDWENEDRVIQQGSAFLGDTLGQLIANGHAPNMKGK